MLRVHSIESFSDPRLQPYRTMRWQEEHRRQQIFVAEGEKVVRRLLESSLRVISVLLPEKWAATYGPILEQRLEEVDLFVAEKKILENLTGFSMYQGVLAVGQIPAAVSLQTLLNTAPKPALFAAVEGVSSAENLGGLVRNCSAFGVQGILIGETTCSPYLRRAVRASMGTLFQLPVVECASLPLALQQLRAAGVSTFAAHPHTGESVFDADFSGSLCLVLGSEGTGLSEETLRACDHACAIPMAPGVDSLNVGAAGAVFLYEIVRQRKILGRAAQTVKWSPSCCLGINDAIEGSSHSDTVSS